MSASRQLYTFQQAAAILACSAKTVQREVKAGRLPFVLVRNRRRIDAGDLARYIDAGRRQVQEENPWPSTSRRAASTGTTRSRQVVCDFEAALAARRKRPPSGSPTGS